MGFAEAIIGSSVLGIGASIFGSEKSSSASQAATQAGVASQDAAIAAQWNMYQQNRADFAPWREAGKTALGDLTKMVKAGPGAFVPSEQPGYEFGFKNFVEKPYLSAQSAKGKRLSGETIKGLTGYAQDYASTSYDNFLNRYYQRLNPYANLAGVGQIATGNTAASGQQTASSIAGLQTNIGNLQAQNALNQGSYQTQMAAGIAGAGQNAFQNYLNYQAYQNQQPFNWG